MKIGGLTMDSQKIGVICQLLKPGMGGGGPLRGGSILKGGISPKRSMEVRSKMNLGNQKGQNKHVYFCTVLHCTTIRFKGHVTIMRGCVRIYNDLQNYCRSSVVKWRRVWVCWYICWTKKSWLRVNLSLGNLWGEKSPIRETFNLATCADHRTDKNSNKKTYMLKKNRCDVSGVTGLVSRTRCHMSGVRCHMSPVTKHRKGPSTF